MGLAHSPRIVTDGLVLYLDAGNTKSYDKFENLLTYSEQYDNAIWSKTGSTITSNVTATTAPDGGVTSDKLIGNNAVTTRQAVSQTISVTSGVTYTFSVFLKQAERRYGTIWFDNSGITEGAFWGAATYFDLQTGTIASGSQSKIIEYPNGWYRVYVTATPNFTGNLSFATSIGTPNNSLDGAGTAAYQYTGDGTSGFYIWGGQVEKGVATFLPTDYYGTVASNKIRGSTWTDLSGNGRTATINGSPAFASGFFDITSDSTYISLSNSGLSPRTGDFTYSCWINFDAVDGADTIFENGSWTDTLLFRYESTQFTVYAEASLRGTIPWTAVTGSWRNIVLIRQSTTVSCYINNVLTGTPFAMNVDIDLANPNLWLMRSQHTVNQFTNGKIATFSIYNRALSASEVQRNFNALRGRFNI